MRFAKIVLKAENRKLQELFISPISEFPSLKKMVSARSHFLPAALCLGSENSLGHIDQEIPLIPPDAQHATGALKLLRAIIQ